MRDVLTYALFPQVATDFFKYRDAQKTKVDAKAGDTENGAYRYKRGVLLKKKGGAGMADTGKEVLEMIKTRRSIRKFKPDMVPEV